MRKIILSAIIFCMVGGTLQAQEFRFGLTASPAFDWLKVNGELYGSSGTKFGFQYGLLFDQTIGNVERYAFSTGLLINYANSGIVYTDTALNFDSELDLRVQYIEIPLTIRLRTNEVNYISYYGQFGLTPGICIKARGDSYLNGDVVDEDINFRDKNNTTGSQYQLFDLNLTIGGGLEYSMAENTSIMAGVFFQNGFVNVIDDSEEDNDAFLKQFGIRLAVLF
ncbi:MAG: porin family protein [Chitinophagales bacterium]